MPQYCCVPCCTSNTGGHIFPRNPCVRMKWRVVIKRVDQKSKKLWVPGRHDVVCHKHFQADDYRTVHSHSLGERKNLKRDAVPSIFSFTPEMSQSALRRKRHSPNQRVQAEVDINITDIGNYETVVTTLPESETAIAGDCDLNDGTIYVECAVQCSLIKNTFSVEKYMFEPQAIQYYTSFDDYEHFMMFFNVLGPVVDHLDYKCSMLTPKNQLFLTLMKLRQAKDDMELVIMFGLSQSVVSQIVNTWINFLFFQLKEINIWPSKTVTQDTMPENFKLQYPSTRVILDATEIPIQKPSNVQAQSATFSSYKNKNTLKTIIGCTPRGLICYVSSSYGGSTSDRQIIERSKLCTSSDTFFEKNDSIMADRGIMVQDLFASKDVFVNTPTMLKGKSQLEPAEVVHDRRVASKRIHIERVIGLGKTFKILKKDLSHTKVIMGERIIFICFSINNFRNSIVGLLA